MTYKEALIDLKSIYKGHGGLYTDDSPAWELAFDVLEKQVPSKPNEVLGLRGKEFCCPYCDEEIELIPRDKDETTYCLHCGQTLDWSDVQ